MKETKYPAILIVISWIHLGPFCYSEISFEESYASKFWTKEGYDWILRGNAKWSERPNETPGKEAIAARPFIRELCSTNRPPLELYAKQDINENPIAVLWSEFFLAREGIVKELQLPAYFRHLFLVSGTLDQHLKNKEDRVLLSRLFLDAVRNLQREHFLQRYYDQEWQDYYKQLWEVDLPTHLVRMVDSDPDYVRGFVRELLLLQNELSAWYWDREFAKRLVTDYARNAFKGSLYQRVIRSNPDRTHSESLEPREFEEITALPATSMLTLHDFKKELVPFYQELSREIVERYYEKTRDILEAFAAYAEMPSCDTNWMLNVFERMAPAMRGTLSWLSIREAAIQASKKPQEGERIEISSAAMTRYHEVGLPVSAEPSASDLEKMRVALLADRNCLNYYLIKALQATLPAEREPELWSKWREAVNRQIWIRNHYERCIGILGQDRLCHSYETDDDRFLSLLHNIEVLQAQLGGSTAAGVGLGK